MCTQLVMADVHFKISNIANFAVNLFIDQLVR